MYKEIYRTGNWVLRKHEQYGIRIEHIHKDRELSMLIYGIYNNHCFRCDLEAPKKLLAIKAIYNLLLPKLI